MLQIRGQSDMERYNLLMDEQVVIGWDNLTTHSEESSQNNGKYNRKHSYSEGKCWIQDCMQEYKGIRSEKLQWTRKCIEEKEQNRGVPCFLSCYHTNHTRNLDRQMH